MNSWMWCLLLLVYNWKAPCTLAAKLRNGNGDVAVEEVPYGKTVVLKCHSNDKDHVFMFWLLASNDVVGPGNEHYDYHKYKYEVLTGNLTIRAVSMNEQGLYNCFSHGVRNSDINIRTVRMIIKKDWEEVYEHDPTLNIFRVVLALGTIALIGGGAYLGYKTYKNRLRNPSYLDQSDEEDSAEELFRAPSTSTSRGTASIVIDTPRDPFGDSPGISTDFGSILDNHK